MRTCRRVPEVDAPLTRIRRGIRDRLRLAATVGYGPRFLHSTGQLHKGDGGHGRFVQITCEDRRDLPIPDGPGESGSTTTFGVLKAAQALGDRQALIDGGRAVLRLHLTGGLAEGLRVIEEAFEQALAADPPRRKEKPGIMQLGMIGLGRMGANMTTRLLRDGHELIVHDHDAEAVQTAEGRGARGAQSLAELAAQLDTPRAVWVMVPSGRPTEDTVSRLGAILEAGDTVIDGGNSNYRDTVRRGDALGERGLAYVDVGTSGGVWGLDEGYSLMIGGETAAVSRLRPIFESLAPSAGQGWGRVGPTGAGHFAKMIHNGIEYGMMQAFAEGFAIMKKKKDFDLNLHQVAEIWRHGSVVRSWLLDLTSAVLGEDEDLSGIAPYVSDSGEGRWTVAEAVDLDVPAPVLTHALLARLRSRDEESYSDRLLAAMRNRFGGHSMKKAGQHP